MTVNLGASTASGGDAEGDTLSGIENITGSAQADTLTGDGNANTLDGDGGDDTLIGGAGRRHADRRRTAATPRATPRRARA